MKPDYLPQPEMFIFGIPADKVAHFLMFLPFPILMYMMLSDKSRKIWLDILLLAGILAMGIGAAFGTEFLQSLTQYRSADIKDTFADMKGLGTGGLLVLLHILSRRNGK
jgi:VanZ family protein